MSRYVSAGKKLFQFLVPKTNVPKTSLDKAKSSLKIQKHKTKMSGAKLDQTRFGIKNPKSSTVKYTFDPDKKNVKKASKGRKELKDGSKKSDFGAQSVKYGLDKNYGVTEADRIAKFVGKKNKKKVI